MKKYMKRLINEYRGLTTGGEGVIPFPFIANWIKVLYFKEKMP